jgi:hypothetical protein
MPITVGALGWRGYLYAAGYVYPFNTCDISKVTELYESQSVHGGGLGTVDGVYHSQHNVAQGKVLAQGRVSGEVFAGTNNYASGFKELLKRAIGAVTSDTSLRDLGFDKSEEGCLVFNPGRSNELKLPDEDLVIYGVPAKAVISQMTLRGNPNGIVECEFEVMSTGASDRAAIPPATDEFAYEDVGCNDDSKPVPFWDSRFDISAAAGEANLVNRITRWEITVVNNTTGIWAFNGQQRAVDMLQGIMVVTGSFDYFSADGSFVSSLCHGATLNITLGAAGGNPIVLHSPYVAFDQSPIPNTGPNNPVYRNVRFRCLAQQPEASLHILSGL